MTRFCNENRLTLPRAPATVRHGLSGDPARRTRRASSTATSSRRNVLVAMQDGKPVAKVIDFGLAKAIEQPLTDETRLTQFGAIVGTLEYMSPEQADPSGQGVDTRTDVYSLGVMLYELLTGTTPLDRVKRYDAACSARCSRGSGRKSRPGPAPGVAGLGDRLPTIAAQRKTEPARLAKLLRGELDWIVLKALEKDRKRRYETASGLAKDVQRYLNDEPVEACPPAAVYRLGKFAQAPQTGGVGGIWRGVAGGRGGVAVGVQCQAGSGTKAGEEGGILDAQSTQDELMP